MSREHGTRAMYVVERCRCDDCRRAVREYERERVKRTVPAYVDATEAREHLRALSAAGMGWKHAARAAGVPVSTVWKLLYGKRGRGPSKRCRRETADRILSVTVDQAADGSRVPAKETLRNVKILVARGWSKAAIARAIGQSDRALQIGSEWVTRKNARSIARLLDEPVPARRSRFGLHPVPFDIEAHQRDEARRLAQREARATYRALEAVEDDDQAVAEAIPMDPYDLPVLAVERAEWKRRAVCRRPEYPTWLFFATDAQAVEKAREACGRCPVRVECRQAGAGEIGMWGGVTHGASRAAS